MICPKTVLDKYDVRYIYDSLWWSLEIISYNIDQRKLDPGKESPEGVLQVRSQKEYQDLIIISFVHLEKINIFCFIYNGVVQKLSLPGPLEN